MRKWSCPTRASQGLGVLQRRMWSWQAARVWTSWRILEVRLYRSHVATAAATSSIRTWVAFAPSTACGGIVGSWRAFGRQLLGPLLVVHGCPHVNNCRVRRPSLPCRFEGLVLDRAQLALRDPGRSRDRASRHASCKLNFIVSIVMLFWCHPRLTTTKRSHCWCKHVLGV